MAVNRHGKLGGWKKHTRFVALSLPLALVSFVPLPKLDLLRLNLRV